MQDMGAELAEELPGFEVPIDKKGAKYLFTINSKEPFAEPEDMFFWWRILYCRQGILDHHLGELGRGQLGPFHRR